MQEEKGLAAHTYFEEQLTAVRLKSSDPIKRRSSIGR